MRPNGLRPGPWRGCVARAESPQSPRLDLVCPRQSRPASRSAAGWPPLPELPLLAEEPPRPAFPPEFPPELLPAEPPFRPEENIFLFALYVEGHHMAYIESMLRAALAFAVFPLSL